MTESKSLWTRLSHQDQQKLEEWLDKIEQYSNNDEPGLVAETIESIREYFAIWPVEDGDLR